jgi:hypothetical protein
MVLWIGSRNRRSKKLYINNREIHNLAGGGSIDPIIAEVQTLLQYKLEG